MNPRNISGLALIFFTFLATACGESRDATQPNPVNGVSASPNDSFPVVDHCWFQQDLLRDAAVELSSSSGYTVNLSAEVNKIDNLAIDSPNLSGKHLNEIMDFVVKYLNDDFKVNLHWQRVGAKTILVDQTQVSATASAPGPSH